jgi:uncharacterized protein with GYD domain
MKTYITLITFTEQGVASIQASPERAETFVKEAEKLGINVKGAYWTLGNYDGVLIFEAANEESAMAALLTLGRAKNVKTHTLRAFDSSEIASILEELSWSGSHD